MGSSVMGYPKTQGSHLTSFVFVLFLLYGTRNLGSWHLRLLFLSNVYVNNKLSNATIVVLIYLYQIHQSGLGLSLSYVYFTQKSNDHAGCYGKTKKLFMMWKRNLKTIEGGNIKL